MPKRPRPSDDVKLASSTLRLCAGSYEHVLYGVDAHVTANASGILQTTFTPVYMFEAHTAIIKTCAIGGRFMASGGADEVLKLYDMKKRKDLGSLLSHDGTITAIKFPIAVDGVVTHMISADENNRLIIWRCKDWTPQIQLTTRHGVVNDLSIHPSGKICISVGKDRQVRLWNLVTGKKAAAFKLGKEEPLRVAWNKQGDGYAILYQNSIGIYDMSAVAQHLFEAGKSRFHDMAWLTRPDGTQILVASKEDGSIQILDTLQASVLQTLIGHQTRVKAVSVCLCTPESSTSGEISCIASASTDGVIMLWACANESKDEFTCIGEYMCGGSRLTCLATCDAAIEDLESIVKRRTTVKEESPDDADIKSEDEDEEDDDQAEEEEFTGF